MPWARAGAWCLYTGQNWSAERYSYERNDKIFYLVLVYYYIFFFLDKCNRIKKCTCLCIRLSSTFDVLSHLCCIGINNSHVGGVGQREVTFEYLRSGSGTLQNRARKTGQIAIVLAKITFSRSTSIANISLMLFLIDLFSLLLFQTFPVCGLALNFHYWHSLI